MLFITSLENFPVQSSQSTQIFSLLRELPANLQFIQADFLLHDCNPTQSPNNTF